MTDYVKPWFVYCDFLNNQKLAGFMQHARCNSYHPHCSLLQSMSNYWKLVYNGWESDNGFPNFLPHGCFSICRSIWRTFFESRTELLKCLSTADVMKKEKKKEHITVFRLHQCTEHIKTKHRTLAVLVSIGSYFWYHVGWELHLTDTLSLLQNQKWY